MSISMLGINCKTTVRFPFSKTVSIEPDHDKCPGGEHIPGILGGWDCICPCHKKEK